MASGTYQSHVVVVWPLAAKAMTGNRAYVSRLRIVRFKLSRSAGNSSQEDGQFAELTLALQLHVLTADVSAL